VKIGILGTICSNLPITYRLVILSQLESNSVLMKNESSQQRNENSQFKIHLALKHLEF